MTKVRLNFPHISEYNEKGRVGKTYTKLWDENDQQISDEKNGIKSDKTISPMCFSGEMNLAVDNRGRLLPCCHCDTPKMLSDPEFKKLVDNSHINDYDKIEDILDTEHWQAFHKSLENNRGPWACWDTCRANKPGELKQEMVVAEEGKLKIWERK